MYFKPQESLTRITENRTETIIEKRDSVVFVYDTLRIVKKVFLLDTIKQTIRENSKVILKDEVRKELVETKDTFNLKNAVVRSQIISEGKIFSHKVDVSTFDKHINTERTIETTKYNNRSVLFLNFEPLVNFKSIIGGEVSVDYTLRNKIRFGAGIGFNTLLPKTEEIYLKAKIGIPLN
ncbi:hypothetical protein [uncultured Tenacibaculum sp.]|uniref:hypothetical protein n=1 Tax=uncultured Tenacibaculum sp. TaxID=174713 RepID=UPI002639CFF5|nr:hypothetical protein [uncultured Tenacibaculum sp.]